jgi:hypothetical protein
MTEVMFKMGVKAVSLTPSHSSFFDPVVQKVVKAKSRPKVITSKPKKVWETPTMTKLVEKGEMVGDKPTKTRQPKSEPKPEPEVEVESKSRPKPKAEPKVKTQPSPWAYTGQQIAKEGPISGLWAGIKKYPWEVGVPVIAPIALPAIGYLGYRLLRRSNE